MRDLRPDHASDHLSAVHPHPQLEAMVGLVLDLEGEDFSQEVQRHLAQLHGVVLAIGDGNTRSNHVRVTDCLDLQEKR